MAMRNHKIYDFQTILCFLSIFYLARGILFPFYPFIFLSSFVVFLPSSAELFKTEVKRERQNVMPSEQKLENHIWEDIFANQ